jgi:hypothetical protein
MVHFSSDFECGNSKNFRKIGKDRYRCEVVGDKKIYCYYFCFDVHNEGPATEVSIEVWHDPLVNDVSGFISHFPSTIWVAPQEWNRYRPLDQTCVEVHKEHLVIHLSLEANKTLRVTDNWPSPYSDTCAFLKKLAGERQDRCCLFTIGKSVQGREIIGLRAGTPGAPRMLCIAGQHPIEFPGVWAMRAIADYISSAIGEVQILREKMLIEVIPLVNPDGTVLGRNAFTSENFDMYVAFGSKPNAQEPEAAESKLLWRWITEKDTALWMNVHCYLGWRNNSEPPFDGWYEVPRGLFSDSKRKHTYEALCDTMRLETDSPSTTMEPDIHTENTLEYQIAKRYGIPSVFYEINGGTAGAFQSGKRGLRVFKNAVKTFLDLI